MHWLEFLSRLGNIGLQHEAIQAIDINPVKIRHNGTSGRGRRAYNSFSNRCPQVTATESG